MWKEGDSWTFTPVLSIGLSTDDSRYQFGSITAVAWLSDGTIAVADQYAHNVRFFSSDGTFLSSVGRNGSGPGEFADLADLLVGPNDTILTIDWGTVRASRITSDGQWHGSFSFVPQEGFYTAYWDDDLATGQIASYLGPLFGRGAPADRRFGFVVRRDMQGSVLDTIAGMRHQESATRTSGGATLLHYYRGRAEFDLCNGTVIVGDQDDYILRWHRVDGTVTRIVTMNRAPIPMTEKDQQILKDAIDRIVRERGGSPARAAARKAAMRFEDHYPAWRRLVCGPAGTLLVQRTRPLRDLTDEEVLRVGSSTEFPGGDWDAFDATGRYLGAVPFPAEPGRHAFFRDANGSWLMLSATQDDLGVPYVGIWRIEGVGGA